MLIGPLPPEFEIFTTGDGSPTLSLPGEGDVREKMHHSGGALTESLYIYHHGLELALASDCAPHVLSIGTGLAYNELISVATFAQRTDWKLWTFEAHPYLRESFRAWLGGTPAPMFDDVAARIAAHFHLPDLSERARAAFREGRIEIRASFPEDAAGVHHVGVVFYDAFSKKMSPALWEEKAVEAALRPLLDDRAVLCTYAATGAMNRVLRNLDFELLARPGFQGKRESTLGIRPRRSGKSA